MAICKCAALLRLPGFSVPALLSSLALTSAKLTLTGLSVSLDNVYYYISPFSSAKVEIPQQAFPSAPEVFGFKALTVVNQGNFSTSHLDDLFANWTAIDDVLTPSFAKAVLLTRPEKGHQASSESVVPLKNIQIPPGLFFLEAATGNLYRVYRLYEDFAGAFMEAVIPTADGKFQALSAKIPGSASLTVGVPPRLYFTKTEFQPLAGRLGVKDVFGIAGMKGSNGNRAWYNLYTPADRTATTIQNLIDAGAQVVGLKKTSQFANSEMATRD